MATTSEGDVVEFSNSDNTRRIKARVLRLVSARCVEIKEVKGGRVRTIDPVATNMRPFSAGA